MKAKITNQQQVYNYYEEAARRLDLTRFERGRDLPEDWQYLEAEVLGECLHENGVTPLVGIEFQDGSQFVIGKSGLEIFGDPPPCSPEHWKQILPIIQAFVDGREVTVYGGTPLKKFACFSRPASSYAIAPRTHKINGFQVPAPEQEAPADKASYWVPNPVYSGFCQEFIWHRCGANDSRNLARGLVHLTKAAAVANAKAMVGIDPNE